MEYLNELDFNELEINELNKKIPELIKNKLISSEKLVLANLNYLLSLGIENYKIIFMNYYEIFLTDYSFFVEIFDKYEKEELIKFLKNDYTIIEYL